MRKLIVFNALVAVLSSPALAASWQEFDDPDAGFSVTFPGQPKVETSTYAAGGVSLPERVYSLTQDSRIYRMQVVDFSSTSTTKADAIKQAVSAWGAKGQVIEDTFARIDTDFGRNLYVAEKDGSRSVGSIFFVSRKLYIIEGISLPTDKDPQSNDPTRFRESLSFMSENAGGGNGRRGGGRRGGSPPDGATPPLP